MQEVSGLQERRSKGLRDRRLMGGNTRDRWNCRTESWWTAGKEIKGPTGLEGNGNEEDFRLI